MSPVPKWIAVCVLLLPACQGPVRVATESRAVIHNPPVADYGPLVARTVVPGAADGLTIAIVDVDGILLNQPLSGLGSLGDNPVALFREKLDLVARDPCCCAVVVRINSPGGGVTATDIMRYDLERFRAGTGKPVVACLMDVGAGGAYYLATAADHIVAHPTTITGGIGVILNLYNLQDAMMQFNVSGHPIKAGPYIDLGTPIAPLDAPSQAILQQIADEYHQRFRLVVVASRPRVDAASPEVFDGRVLLASHAVECGLIDSIGYLDDAVRLARELSGAYGAPAVMLHRAVDPARTPYSTATNVPLQGNLLPLSVPGLDRSQMPTFLYLWQPEPTWERRASGR